MLPHKTCSKNETEELTIEPASYSSSIISRAKLGKSIGDAIAKLS